MENTELSINEILGKSTAILHSDGLTLFRSLQNLKKMECRISFKGITHCTTAFLNASVGKFLLENKEARVQFVDLTDDIQRKINLVLDNIAHEKKRTNIEGSSRSFFYA